MIQTWKIFMISTFLLVLSQSALAESNPSTVWSNRKGIEELKKSNAAEAKEKFLSALSQNPFEARLHLNLGLSFEAMGQLDNAKASYQTALQLAQDTETAFAANFNLGALAHKEKKTDEALAFYQEALKYNPESKETKTNIELLTQDQQGKGQGEGDQQDQQNQNGGQGQNQQPNDQQKKDGEKDQSQGYAQNRPQPKKFKSEELSQGDVNKILGEIKQQEQKIRAEFQRKEVKEKPREKDW